jgi:hypothetical protein
MYVVIVLIRNGVYMAIIEFKNTGSFDKTKKFLNNAGNTKELIRKARIEVIAQEGVRALASKTPVRTGKTASSWSYSIEDTGGKTTISWENSNVINGVNIAIILQYGHGTKNGGYVVGRDYINPALRPIFELMANEMWKAVVSL